MKSIRFKIALCGSNPLQYRTFTISEDTTVAVFKELVLTSFKLKPESFRFVSGNGSEPKDTERVTDLYDPAALFFIRPLTSLYTLSFVLSFLGRPEVKDNLVLPRVNNSSEFTVPSGISTVEAQNNLMQMVERYNYAPLLGHYINRDAILFHPRLFCKEFAGRNRLNHSQIGFLREPVMDHLSRLDLADLIRLNRLCLSRVRSNSTRTDLLSSLRELYRKSSFYDSLLDEMDLREILLLKALLNGTISQEEAQQFTAEDFPLLNDYEILWCPDGTHVLSFAEEALTEYAIVFSDSSFQKTLRKQILDFLTMGCINLYGFFVPQMISDLCRQYFPYEDFSCEDVREGLSELEDLNYYTSEYPVGSGCYYDSELLARPKTIPEWNEQAWKKGCFCIKDYSEFSSISQDGLFFSKTETADIQSILLNIGNFPYTQVKFATEELYCQMHFNYSEAECLSYVFNGNAPKLNKNTHELVEHFLHSLQSQVPNIAYHGYSLSEWSNRKKED